MNGIGQDPRSSESDVSRLGSGSTRSGVTVGVAEKRDPQKTTNALRKNDGLKKTIHRFRTCTQPLIRITVDLRQGFSASSGRHESGSHSPFHLRTHLSIPVDRAGLTCRACSLPTVETPFSKCLARGLPSGCWPYRMGDRKIFEML
jgi:hypothetical protein